MTIDEFLAWMQSKHSLRWWTYLWRSFDRFIHWRFQPVKWEIDHRVPKAGRGWCK